MKNYLIWSTLKQRKIRKRFYEDWPFKEREKVCCLSRIEETEGRKTYIIFLLNKKTKDTKYERY